MRWLWLMCFIQSDEALMRRARPHRAGWQVAKLHSSVIAAMTECCLPLQMNQQSHMRVMGNIL